MLSTKHNTDGHTLPPSCCKRACVMSYRTSHLIGCSEVGLELVNTHVDGLQVFLLPLVDLIDLRPARKSTNQRSAGKKSKRVNGTRSGSDLLSLYRTSFSVCRRWKLKTQSCEKQEELPGLVFPSGSPAPGDTARSDLHTNKNYEVGLCGCCCC